MNNKRTNKKENKKINKTILLVVLSIIAVIFVITSIIARNNKKYKIEKVENYNYFVLQQDDKFGVIDTKGNTIITPKYDEVIIPNPSKDVFICKESDATKVYNKKSEEILNKYNKIEAIKLENIASDLMYEKSILKFEKNGNIGLINFKGKEILKPKYTSIKGLPSKEGELIVQNNDKYGIVNMKGNEIIKCEYDTIDSDNYYTDEDQYSESGYIVGNKTEQGYRYGYIDSKGKRILKNEYNEISRITEIKDNKNIYLIAAKNGQYRLIKNGKEITKDEYPSMLYNSDSNLIIVEKNQKQGAINIEGKEIIPIKYDEVNINGLYIYAQDYRGTVVFDRNGKEINLSPNLYKYNTENSKYLITIDTLQDDTKYGVCDKDGKQLIQENYSYIEYLFGDYFIASNENRKLGIIDINSNIKIDFKYDSIQKIAGKNMIQATMIEDELTQIYTNYLEKASEMKNASVEKNDNYIKLYNENETKYFDNNGTELKNTQIFTNNKLFVKKQNGKYGFSDKDGNIKVQCIYDMATEFNKYGFAGIRKGNKWGVVDEEGNAILEPTYEINQFEPDFVGKYYKATYGFGEFYYTDANE